MIIVLLLFFQSICLYCQRLVLHVYDRWINPKNTRILKEAAELTGNPKLLQQQSDLEQKKRNRKSCLGNQDSCRFCVNTPQGYCRHHFHLQELEIQKQQRGWNPLAERDTEYRQWRKANRELKRNLKNRLLVQQQQQEQAQQQFQRQRRNVTQTWFGNKVYNDEIVCNTGDITNATFTITSAKTLENSSSSTSIYIDSGYCSMDATATTTFYNGSSENSIGDRSPIETVYCFEPSQQASNSSSTNTLSLSSGSYVQGISMPVTTIPTTIA